MGASVRESNVEYYSIINGKVVRRVPPNTPGAVSRENKEGKVVWEINFTDLSGFLSGIEVVEGDYGKQVKVKLEDDQGTYVVQLHYSSVHVKTLLRMLPNINLSKEINIHPYVYEKEGKQKSGMWINPKGVKKSIEWFYTRETPHGMPDMVQVKVKGELVWDDTDQMEFLLAEAQKTLRSGLVDRQEVNEPEMVDGKPVMSSYGQNFEDDEYRMPNEPQDVPFPDDSLPF